MITHGELFAGIGGFGCGFGRVGIETKWHVEIDKQCQSILIRHWIETQIESNVCLVGKHNLCLVDIISFGSPCQDLSIAGLRKGFQDGTRSNLFFEAVRIIREIEPRYAIWENVPGALSSHGGRDFQSVLESLLETSVPMPKSGRWATAGMVRTGQKEIAWRVLDAQYFRVPQRRRRIFLIFCPRGDSAAEVLFEREGGAGNNPTSGEAGKEVAYSLRANPSHSGDKGDGGINTTLLAFGWNKSSSQTMSVTEKTGALQASPTSNPAIWHNHQQDGSIRMQEDGTAPTVSRQWGTGGNNVLFVSVRRLMPIECERLQGFTNIKETITIDVCLDHQKNSASVEIQSRKSQKHAESVGKIDLSESAPFVEMNTNTNDQPTNKLAQPSVLINCGERKVEILNQEKLLLSASFAEDKNLFPLLTQSEDFALLLAGLNTILAQITHHGAEALHPKEQSLIHLKDGLSAVRLSGNEMMQLVKNAENDSIISKKLLKSIISDPLNLKIADTTLTTLLYSVIRAISGYIPEEILKSNSFKIEINTDFGYTFGQSDSARYKQLGNAVAVPVVEWIGKRIMAATCPTQHGPDGGKSGQN